MRYSLRIFTPLLMILISVTAAAAVLAQDIGVGEQMLTDHGIAYGIVNDPAGYLYITDWKMGEVWRVNVSTGAYTTFKGLGNTLDARPDSAGDIWLTSFWNPYLNRINTSSNPVTMTTWDLSTWDSGRTFNLSGLAFDDIGRVWFSEWGEVSDTQLLYRFDPQTNQLCGYTLPGGNHSWYLLYQAPYLWLGDWTQALILRFNTTTQEVTYWGAGSRAEPRGLALDEMGNIWWADVFSGKLARLFPDTNTLTTFYLPDAGSPNYGVPYMVAVHGGKIFYSAQGDEVGTFGILDPSIAVGSSSTAKRYTFKASEICQSLPGGTTKMIAATTNAWSNPWRSISWMDVTPISMPGWIMFEAPGAEMPYGISINADLLWITDQMYNKLIRVAIPTPSSTQTPSPTPTITPSQTATNTVTQSSTPTSTTTTAQVPTHTATQTPSPTSTITPTQTATFTATQKPSSTATMTVTQKETHTATNSPSPTPTKTMTQTPSPTSTNTSTHTPKQTATQTPSPVVISTPSDKEIKYHTYIPIIMISP